MMSVSIRRKALSLCSSALTNNGQPALAGSAARGYVAGIPLFEAFVGRSKLVPGIYQGAPVYSKPSRDADFPIQKWIRSFSTYSESGVHGDTYEPLSQVQTDKCNFASEIEKTDNKRTHSGPAFFTVSGAAVVGSVLSTPIVNAPQAAKLGVGSTVSSTFLPNLVLFWISIMA